MADSIMKIWHPAGVYRGLFDGYIVGANRHQDADGNSAWHVTAHRNDGGDYRPRDYWIVDGHFRKTLRKMVGAGGSKVETDHPECDVEAFEKVAILKAISEWEKLPAE